MPPLISFLKFNIDYDVIDYADPLFIENPYIFSWKKNIIIIVKRTKPTSIAINTGTENSII